MDPEDPNAVADAVTEKFMQNLSRALPQTPSGPAVAGQNPGAAPGEVFSRPRVNWKVVGGLALISLISAVAGVFAYRALKKRGLLPVSLGGDEEDDEPEPEYASYGSENAGDDPEEEEEDGEDD